jgi:hypothetical protein
MYSLPGRLGVIAIEWLFGIPLPRKIDGDDGKPFAEQWQDAPPSVPALWKASQKDDNWATAALNEMKAQTRSLDLPLRESRPCQDELRILLLIDHGCQEISLYVSPFQRSAMLA